VERQNQGQRSWTESTTTVGTRGEMRHIIHCAGRKEATRRAK
jgi:hypothetical protein